MRKLLIVCQLIALTFLAAPASAATGGHSDTAKRCQSDYASLGFRNVGQCVSLYANGGGTVVPGPAILTLTFDTAPCATNFAQTCVWSVQGSGLQPGSKVIVGEEAVTFGAELTVDSAGNISADGIYQLGSCITSGSESTSFIARGVAADGTPIASDVVIGNYLQYLQICV